MTILICIILLAILAYFVFLSRDSFISFPRSKGGSIRFSGSGISIQPDPDQYPVKGFDHIQPYVSRLSSVSKHHKSLSIFTPDGNRGLYLSSRDGRIEATLIVQLINESERERAIRSFFASAGIQPSQDYLAATGGVNNSIRILSYGLEGNVDKLTTMIQRILQELCGVSPMEALNIAYEGS